MSDWTEEEFKSLLGLEKREEANPLNIKKLTPSKSYVDWVASGAVTPVQNQKFCKAGWVFSVTGAMEGSN
jgi:C1A family cysteine protease